MLSCQSKWQNEKKKRKWFSFMSTTNWKYPEWKRKREYSVFYQWEKQRTAYFSLCFHSTKPFDQNALASSGKTCECYLPCAITAALKSLMVLLEIRNEEDFLMMVVLGWPCKEPLKLVIEDLIKVGKIFLIKSSHSFRNITLVVEFCWVLFAYIRLGPLRAHYSPTVTMHVSVLFQNTRFCLAVRPRWWESSQI